MDNKEQCRNVPQVIGIRSILWLVITFSIEKSLLVLRNLLGQNLVSLLRKWD
jgi:hypothetical protein